MQNKSNFTQSHNKNIITEERNTKNNKWHKNSLKSKPKKSECVDHENNKSLSIALICRYIFLIASSVFDLFSITNIAKCTVMVFLCKSKWKIKPIAQNKKQN